MRFQDREFTLWDFNYDTPKRRKERFRMMDHYMKKFPLLFAKEALLKHEIERKEIEKINN